MSKQRSKPFIFHRDCGWSCGFFGVYSNGHKSPGAAYAAWKSFWISITQPWRSQDAERDPRTQHRRQSRQLKP